MLDRNCARARRWVARRICLTSFRRIADADAMRQRYVWRALVVIGGGYIGPGRGVIAGAWDGGRRR